MWGGAQAAFLDRNTISLSDTTSTAVGFSEGRCWQVINLSTLIGTKYESSKGRWISFLGYQDAWQGLRQDQRLCCSGQASLATLLWGSRWLDNPDSLLTATVNGTQSSMLLTLERPVYNATAKVQNSARLSPYIFLHLHHDASVCMWGTYHICQWHSDTTVRGVWLSQQLDKLSASRAVFCADTGVHSTHAAP